MARGLVQKHFPNGDAPEGLLIDVVKVIRSANVEGYKECWAGLMADYAVHDNDNDFKTEPF